MTVANRPDQSFTGQSSKGKGWLPGLARLRHYISYLALADDQKTRWMIALAEQDPFCATIVRELQAYGYSVRHRFYGPAGGYVPESLQVAATTDMAQALQQLRDNRAYEARFLLSSRRGGAQAAQYFLHELIHFWQDLHGLFLTPLRRAGTPVVMLDATSHVRLSCWLEAMAATEAIRAAHRLAHLGAPAAMQGTLASLDWRGLAVAYQQDVQTMAEVEAARRCFAGWYSSPYRRRVYERRALGAYRQRLSGIRAMAGNTTIKTLTLAPMDCAALLPPDPQLAYLRADAGGGSDRGWSLEPDFASAAVASQAAALDSDAGVHRIAGASLADFQHGSVPYLWSRSRA